MLGSYTRRKPYIRAALVLLLGGTSWALYRWLAPQGLAWALWLGLGALLAWILIELWMLRRQRAGEGARWEAWEGALLDEGARAAAIEEVRAEVDAAAKLGSRMKVRHARLSVVLAELLQAAGRSGAAQRALAKVKLDPLEPLQADVIRRARVQAHLRAGDLGAAEDALALRARPEERSSADPLLELAFRVLAQRLRVARAIAMGEEAGAALLEESLEESGALLREAADPAEGDLEIEGELRLARALALHALGREDEARAELCAIDPEAAARLRALENEEAKERLSSL